METQRLVLVILLPRPDARWLHEELVLIQLQVRPQQILDDVHDPRVQRCGVKQVIEVGKMSHLPDRVQPAVGRFLTLLDRRLDLNPSLRHVRSLPRGDLLRPLLQRRHFLIGENAEANAGIVRRLWREGNEIGNHTFDHPNLGEIGPRDSAVNDILSVFQAMLMELGNEKEEESAPSEDSETAPT